MKKFKDFNFGSYVAELKAVKKITRRFKQVTDREYTIDNARHALLNAAEIAMVYFYDEDDEGGNAKKAKKDFHKILAALPYKTFPSDAKLIKAEVFAHINLNYGDTAGAWLTDNFSDYEENEISAINNFADAVFEKLDNGQRIDTATFVILYNNFMKLHGVKIAG